MTSSCGEVAGGVFNKLSERAFKDPLYLKFAYKPLCQKRVFDGKMTAPNVPLYIKQSVGNLPSTAPPVRQNESIWVRSEQVPNKNSEEPYQVGASTTRNGQNVINMDKMAFLMTVLCLSLISR